jgi:glycosyltransferase involved in cell wall biosynthesis
MGRAVDIHPQDGALREKIRDSLLVRTNPRVNVEYLQGFAHCEADRNKIHLTYDGYALTHFSEAPVLMERPFQILSLGRFDRIKGLDVLLKAACLLAKAGVHFHLIMAGAGPRGLYLRLLSRILGIGNRISFPGFITYDGVSQLFSRADVFVMPSVIHRTGERDGIPNVVLEALLHRVPVVATDVAGMGEVIRDGETGFLVAPGNPQALAGAIRKTLDGRSGALAMAERGRKLVLDGFDPQRCHRRVFELFTRLGAES